MSVNQTIDPKTVERIRKLLNLARDGGATEGEANSAMAAAERLMLANNLSTAQIEMSGGAATEARLKNESRGKANYRWQRWLMTAIAQANYVSVAEIQGKRRIGGRNAHRAITLGYELIGRPSNVAATYTMYDYLLQTCARLRAEYQAQPGNGLKEGALFIEGLAYRLAQRVIERHEEQLKKQREEAEAKQREQSARAAHPSAAPSGNSLVVIMEDYQQREKDLNHDLFEGWKPGTTLAKREEREERERAAEARIRELMVKHSISYDIAWNMVHLNHALEEAIAYQAQWEADQAERDKFGRGEFRGGKTREDRLHERLYTSSAGDGRRKADTVSLDQQIDDRKTTAKRIA